MSGRFTSTRPIRRRLTRRRRRTRNPRHKTKWTKGDFIKYAGMAYTGLKLAQQIKKLVNVEIKHFDGAITAQTFDYNGRVDILNLIPQGDTDITRDGDSLKMMNLHLRSQFTVNVNSDCNVRLIVYFDKANVVTAGSDLLEVTGSSAAPWSFKNYDKRFQSKIIFDQRFILTTDAAAQQYVTIDKMFAIGKHTQYEAGTTTINSGALKVLVISDLVTTNLPTVSHYSRITYVDN